MNQRRTRNRSLVSLTPMIIGVAFALAAVALLAWTVLPSRGNDDIDVERPDGEEIVAPDFAFEDDATTPTPTVNTLDRVVRLNDPLELDPTVTPSATLMAPRETSTPDGPEFPEETARVISPPTSIVQPTVFQPEPTLYAPTSVVPTRVVPTRVATTPPEPSRTPVATATIGATREATSSPPPSTSTPIIQATSTVPGPIVTATATPILTQPPPTPIPTSTVPSSTATIAITPTDIGQTPTEGPGGTETPDGTGTPDRTGTPDDTETPDGTETPRVTRTSTPPDGSPDPDD